MQDLNDLYYYVQVVDHGGFAPAGRALRMPKSKLSRRIALLEERLGVRLIHRSSRRFAVTELGGSMPKNDRIRRLIPLFEQGRFYLPVTLPFVDAEGRARDFVREFVDEEYTAFPVAGHDDMLDCLARIVDPDLGAVFPQPRSEQSGHVVNTFNPYE